MVTTREKPKQLTATRKEAEDICGRPGCGCNVSDEGMECDGCAKWFHPHCTGLTNEKYKSRLNSSELPYYCVNCWTQMFKSPVDIEKKFDELHIKIQSIENYLKKICSIIQPDLNTVEKYTTNMDNVKSPINSPNMCLKRLNVDSLTSDGTLSDLESTVVAQINEDHAASTPQSAIDHIKKYPQTDQLPISKTSREKATMTPKPSLGKTIQEHSVIVLNMKEADANTVDKSQEELKQWELICNLLNLKLRAPKHILRINRRPDSPHQTKPRLARVWLNSQEETESVLLAASMLALLPDTETRIMADIPFAQRLWKKENVDNQKERRARNVVLRNVPELDSTITGDKILHDSFQWRCISTKLKLDDVIATKVIRLPRPLHLSQLSAPKLLRVTLADNHMAARVIDEWTRNRHTLDNNIIIHQDLPREERTNYSTYIKLPTLQIPKIDKPTIHPISESSFHVSSSPNSPKTIQKDIRNYLSITKGRQVEDT